MISNQDRDFVRRAAKEASKSSERHQVGAVLVKGGRIIAMAPNLTIKSLHFNPKSYSKHAETRALIKRKHHQDLDGCVCYVVRLRKEQSYGLAKPCPNCESALKEAGISAVFYTTNDPLVPIAYERY